MNAPEALLTHAPRRKSSRSGGGNATCVEAVAVEVEDIE
jgi:hypothetical protein